MAAQVVREAILLVRSYDNIDIPDFSAAGLDQIEAFTYRMQEYAFQIPAKLAGICDARSAHGHDRSSNIATYSSRFSLWHYGETGSARALDPEVDGRDYRELIELEFSRGRNATGIIQDLVDRHGFTGDAQTIALTNRRAVIRVSSHQSSK